MQKKADEIRFFNKRCECYGRLAERMQQGLEFPEYSEDLQTQLSYIPLDLGSEKIKLKSKDKIREKLGYSPDISDALAVTFAVMNCDLLAEINTNNYAKPIRKITN